MAEQKKQESAEKSPIELVKLEYKKGNHHIVHGVHAVIKGLNHFPKSVWDEAKSHPANQQLIKSGDLVEIQDEPAVEEKPAKGKAKGKSEDQTAA